MTPESSNHRLTALARRDTAGDPNEISTTSIALWLTGLSAATPALGLRLDSAA
jgi:hypothetical protein